MLTNDVVSFEQPGPDIKTFSFMFSLKGFVISYHQNPLLDLVYNWLIIGFGLRFYSVP